MNRTGLAWATPLGLGRLLLRHVPAAGHPAFWSSGLLICFLTILSVSGPGWGRSGDKDPAFLINAFFSNQYNRGHGTLWNTATVVKALPMRTDGALGFFVLDVLLVAPGRHQVAVEITDTTHHRLAEMVFDEVDTGQEESVFTAAVGLEGNSLGTGRLFFKVFDRRKGEQPRLLGTSSILLMDPVAGEQAGMSARFDFPQAPFAQTQPRTGNLSGEKTPVTPERVKEAERQAGQLTEKVGEEHSVDLVDVGLPTELEQAQKVVARLKEGGVEAFVQAMARAGETRFQVVAGPFFLDEMVSARKRIRELAGMDVPLSEHAVGTEIAKVVEVSVPAMAEEKPREVRPAEKPPAAPPEKKSPVTEKSPTPAVPVSESPKPAVGKRPAVKPVAEVAAEAPEPPVPAAPVSNKPARVPPALVAAWPREEGAAKAYLQLGSFGQMESIASVSGQIPQWQDRLQVEVVEEREKRFFRLLAGPFATPEEAGTAQQELAARLRINPFVVNRVPGALKPLSSMPREQSLRAGPASSATEAPARVTPVVKEPVPAPAKEVAGQSYVIHGGVFHVPGSAGGMLNRVSQLGFTGYLRPLSREETAATVVCVGPFPELAAAKEAQATLAEKLGLSSARVETVPAPSGAHQVCAPPKW
ncbi:MAG: SPOR domain-containing protein [Magnetococcales bacterium]|nr:SPOR domain-containing protein [Magnetococcales bacterium]